MFGKNEFLSIFRRIKRKDFTGNEGLVIKNSVYQISRTIVAKGGGLLFTIILARFLMPELFGLYSLALATIFIFIGFSDLGISSSIVKFISNSLGKNKQEKAKEYFIYLFKLKIFLVLIVLIILILSSWFISNYYYDKPIFLALIAGSLYVFSLSSVTFMESLFFSVNKFKDVVYKEIIFQFSKLIFILIIIFILMRKSFSEEFTIFLIILSLSLSCFLSLIYLFLRAKKKIIFLRAKQKKLRKSEEKKLNKFILPLTVLALSGLFLGNIDIVMLGHFVESQFIGYYSAALLLIGSAGAFLGFSVALFPIFSRLKGKKLKNALKKSINVVFSISTIFVILFLIFSPIIIKIVYGANYFSSINLLRIFSLILIPVPLVAIYTNYFISKGNTKLIAKLLISITIINIILNYIFISVLVRQSPILGTMGAVIATIFSVYLHLGLLIFFSRKN